MKRYIIILTAIAILYGCNNSNSLPKELSVHEENLSFRRVSKYDFYPDGKIKVARTTDYHYQNGVLTDSSEMTEEIFFYNSKGKIERIVDTYDSMINFKIYNNEDSLVLYGLIVNSDTIDLAKIDFLNGRETKRSFRWLVKKKRPGEHNEYDTAIYTAEHTYDGNKIVSTVFKFSDSTSTETQHIYEGEKEIKTLEYNLVGGKRILKESIYYTYTNDRQDFLTIGATGDTLQWTKYNNDWKLVNTNRKDGLKIEYFDKNDRLVAMVINYIEKGRTYFCFFKYDKQGNFIEQTEYDELISNAR